MFLTLNLEEYRRLFCKNLSSMLSPDELGAYVLVLANSIQDDGLRDALEDALSKNKNSLEKALADNSLHATTDDLDVFEKLSKCGTKQLSSWGKYQIGAWEVMSNPFRSLRPSRVSSEKIKSIRKSFDADTFHFNKPFLKPEILWEGKWHSSNHHSYVLKVLYNKFPFIPYHTIIVPDPDNQCEQYLTQRYHDMIWDLVSETNENLSGFGAGYNSLGACASVNHLHFQGFVHDRSLPIELDHWVHNGGDTDYPMRCFPMVEKDKAWHAIQALHDDDSPYNVLYRNQCCYVIPRQLQGSASVNEAVVGAGWIEECGVFVVADTDEVDRLTEVVISDNLKSLSA